MGRPASLAPVLTLRAAMQQDQSPVKDPCAAGQATQLALRLSAAHLLTPSERPSCQAL